MRVLVASRSGLTKRSYTYGFGFATEGAIVVSCGGGDTFISLDHVISQRCYLFLREEETNIRYLYTAWVFIPCYLHVKIICKVNTKLF